MPTRKRASRKNKPSGNRTSKRSASRKPAPRTVRQRAGSTKRVIVRVAETDTRGPAANTRAAAEPEVPQATIDRSGGAIRVEIAFGHAQHGTYTIQIFDPTGNTEVARESGLSTDAVPDRFDLRLTPAQLDGHFVQWSGAVDAFSNSPGQRFSVIFDVRQDGSVVPGGHVQKTGPLDLTQVFLGVLQLVAA